jgi:type IV pilus assembly protein PilA
MLTRARARAKTESGFTLVELLVVMLILGILMTIAITAFLNQRDKASDSNAKTIVRTMQTAEEACSTDNRGDYSNCSKTALQVIEPAIQLSKSVTDFDATGLTGTGYTVTATSSSGTTYKIVRSSSALTRSCDKPDTGGCRKVGTNTTTGTW